MTRQTLSKYETGESLPDIERCKRLADIFGVSMDDLVNYEKTDRENLGLEVPPKGKHVFGMVKVGDKGRSSSLQMHGRYLTYNRGIIC